MANGDERGLGKCRNGHLSSYGYPTRPDDPFPFCSQCGCAMVWRCDQCGAELPQDSEELKPAAFCRHCGTAYFAEQSAEREERVVPGM